MNSFETQPETPKLSELVPVTPALITEIPKFNTTAGVESTIHDTGPIFEAPDTTEQDAINAAIAQAEGDRVDSLRFRGITVIDAQGPVETIRVNGSEVRKEPSTVAKLGFARRILNRMYSKHNKGHVNK